MTVWCERLILDGIVHESVRLVAGPDGHVSAFAVGEDPHSGDVMIGTALPGAANAHSHAFHRALRGRTHDHGGDFWTWRALMYRTAALLTPERYGRLARAVFAEMLSTGYTAVGEFHYVHHRPDGRPYPHEMELAIADAAADVGIRLTLLDTAYLNGGIGEPLSAAQKRFGDGTAEAFLSRWHELAALVPGLGAAIHSVRGVAPADIRTIVEGLPPDVPLHVHLSEQPKENADSLAVYGATPTRVLAREGMLGPRASVVHATHLTADDIDALGAAGVTVVMCPTTEGDLGDGIGPARELLDAGAALAIGSDQNAVVDPFLETRGLEMQERLRSLRRGRFTMAELGAAMSESGYRSLGHPAPLTVGGPLDLIEIDTRSARTIGAEPAQLVLCATASDIRRVVVGGRVVAEEAALADGRRPEDMLADAIAEVTT
ncbi:formimidoylglutamate deiminase [Microbacterium sp. SLBN-146]|uniref:formimidoylglutamate deiminase n=1 Tax=Microbacterium sp. SLBN-146 TaxID=2768457 RepID=UPI00114DE8D5|nr:formimidoylglutamate deiminase [Microbacterium sp. SLBN-146]TQJ31839.1 formiminoglutamate deiminase [Microbacterium sp. SLBN-146]